MYYVEKKRVFDYKRKISESPKNRIFPKGKVKPCFWSKNAIFFIICFCFK